MATAPQASPSLPTGSRSGPPRIQPRRFAFRDLPSVPQYWFADNPVITHVENAFSLLIPPGERFFIRSVRHFEDRAEDPALREQIRVFAQQEGHHSQAHQDFNDSLAAFGIDVERERAYADRVIRRIERILPKKMCLGATVFFEHLTAVGAHMLFREPLIRDSMPEEMQRFWSWHAAEEIEHKAVAFDLFRAAGGGYLLRVASAITALCLIAIPFDRMVRRMMKDDGKPVTREMRAEARRIQMKIAGPQLRLLAHYFRPGFHPWDLDDRPYLEGWYESIGAEGESLSSTARA